MTPEDIRKEFFVHQLLENPNFKAEDLYRDTTDDDNWQQSHEDAYINEMLKRQFEGTIEPPKTPKQLAQVIRPTGESPIERARNRVTASIKTPINLSLPPLLNSQFSDFEEVYRETNSA
jgi:hypothetical protein